MDPGIPVKNPTKSFWLDEIPDIESPDPIPHTADVVIIGSGISGSSIAYHLGNEISSLDVVVLEGREFASGATGRNGGHLTPVSYRNFRADVSRYGSQEAVRMRRFEADNVHQVLKIADQSTEIRSCWNVHPFESIDEFNDAKRDLEAFNHACPDQAAAVEVWSKDKVGSGTKFIGAIAIPSHTIWPARFAWSLLSQSNARRYAHTVVTRIEGNLIYFTKSGREFTILAKSSIVHATNAYAGHILSVFRSHIIPTRGQMSILVSCDAKDTNISEKTWKHSYSFHKGAEYMISRREGLFLGGGRNLKRGLEQYETNDSVINLNIRTYLTSFIPHHFGSGSSTTLSRDWTGIMGFTKDEAPFIGRLDDINYVCLGFSGHGMPRCYLAARYVADLIQHGSSNISLPQSYVVSEKRLSQTIPNNPLQGLGECFVENESSDSSLPLGSFNAIVKIVSIITLCVLLYLMPTLFGLPKNVY